MDTVVQIEEKPYEAAAPIKKKTFCGHIVAFFQIVGVALLVFLRSFPIGFMVVFRIIIPPRRKDIRGQVALVTGGAHGLGREICLSLAKRGCNLAIADLDLTNAQKTADDCRETYDVKTVAYKLDVTDHKAVEAIRLSIERDLGPVDILVNNAGILATMLFQEGSPEHIQRIIDVNLTAHFWTSRAFIDGMIERKRGHIVAISSILGLMPIANGICYSASKHGVRGMMEALYDELCIYKLQDQIRTTTVYPYFINTSKVISDLAAKYKALENISVLKPSETSETIVEAIQRNNKSLMVPRFFFPGIAFLGYLPIEMQQMIKSYFFASETQPPVKQV